MPLAMHFPPRTCVGGKPATAKRLEHNDNLHAPRAMRMDMLFGPGWYVTAIDDTSRSLHSWYAQMNDA